MMTIIDHLDLDHALLRTLLDRACSSGPDDSDAPVAELVDALVRHETAEAAVVRPRTRETRGGQAVAAQLDRQERRIGRLLATRETLDPCDHEARTELLAHLRAAVVHHLAAEEHAEHPRLRGALAPPTQRELGRRYRWVMGLGDDEPLDGSATSFARARDLVRAALTT